MDAAPADKLIAACVTADVKAKFKSLSQSYGLGESALLRRLIERAIDPVGAERSDAPADAHSHSRAERLYVRLYADDRLLLAERAGARGMPAATYLAVLARSHLRQLAPLPDAERRAFERCVAELSAIGRNLNQVARRANQEGVVSSLSREDIAQFIRVCGVAVEYFKGTIKVNKVSWESGYETTHR